MKKVILSGVIIGLGLVAVSGISFANNLPSSAMLESSYAREGQYYYVSSLKMFPDMPSTPTIFWVYGYYIGLIDVAQAKGSKLIDYPISLIVVDKATDIARDGVDLYSYDSEIIDGLEIGQRYEFKVSGDKGGYRVLSYKNVSVNQKYASDNLIEGRTYTIAELNNNTSKTPKKFFTEAYVTYVYEQLPCPPGTEGICVPPRPPYIIISDTNAPYSYAKTEKDAHYDKFCYKP